jgi:hypothetical protein
MHPRFSLFQGLTNTAHMPLTQMRCLPLNSTDVHTPTLAPGAPLGAGNIRSEGTPCGTPTMQPIPY